MPSDINASRVHRDDLRFDLSPGPSEKVPAPFGNLGWLPAAERSRGGRGGRRIRTQFAGRFRMDEERMWQQQEQRKEEDNPHGEPRIEQTAGACSLLPAPTATQADFLHPVTCSCSNEVRLYEPR